MTPLWMPFYIADHLRKTMHLSAAENGAYLHLIMHYWQHGGLPDDDVRLARIARMTTRQWKAARPVLQAFFHDGWRHDRVDEELAKATDRTMKRKAAGGTGGTRTAAKAAKKAAKRIAKGVANAKQKPTQPQPQSQSQEDGGGGDGRARECTGATSSVAAEAQTSGGTAAQDALVLTSQIAAVAGLGDPKTWPFGWSGASLRVAAWLAGGWQPEVCLAAAREVMSKKHDGPPATITYFEKAIARAHAQRHAPLPVAIAAPAIPEVIHVSPTFGRPGSIVAAGKRSLAEFVERQRLAADQARAGDAGAGTGDALVRLLSAG
jgi:uncharacterized protein YdaU (DUF1376 family)